MTIRWRVTLLLASAIAVTGPARGESSPPSGVFVILDASGSMWGRLDGRTKIEIAREASEELVRALPADTALGFAVYGHRSKGDCGDIEVVAAPRVGGREDLLQRIAAIQPKGMTPITAALERAGEILAPVEHAVGVVLVSDGKETCDGDPCAAARRLREHGMSLRVHVVGFDVGPEEREQLTCIAEAGGGRYVGAGSAAELREALITVRETVAAAPVTRTVTVRRPPTGSLEFRHLQGGNVVIVDAASGEERSRYCNGCGSDTTVPAGTYRLRFDTFELPAVEVASGAPTVVDLNTIAGIVEIRNLQSGGVQIVATDTGKVHARYCNGCGSITQVPAGTYRLKFPNFESEPIEVRPGAVTAFDLHTVAGTLEFPTHTSGPVRVIDAASGRTLAHYCTGCGSNTQVPAGRYRIAFPNVELDDVQVAAGEVVRIE